LIKSSRRDILSEKMAFSRIQGIETQRYKFLLNNRSMAAGSGRKIFARFKGEK
jgi:hypothetical protein